MPTVGTGKNTKKFPYTKAGMRAAGKAAKEAPPYKMGKRKNMNSKMKKAME